MPHPAQHGAVGLQELRRRAGGIRQYRDLGAARLHFGLHDLETRRGFGLRQLQLEALELCCAYTWPGNVLELELALEQACMVCQDGTLKRGDFPRAVQELSPPPLSNAAGHSNSRSCPAAAPNLHCSQLETAGSTTHGYTPPIDEALVPLKKFLRDQEVTYLQRTLAHVGGSKERAAELLGISLATIYRKLSEPETVSEVL